MPTVQKFEDLEIWQLAWILSREIHALTFFYTLASDFWLKAHIRGSSSSFMDNIAEGSESKSRLEFTNSLTTVKGEIGELKSQLYHAPDNHYLHHEKFDELYHQANLLTKKTTGFIT